MSIACPFVIISYILFFSFLLSLCGFHIMPTDPLHLSDTFFLRSALADHPPANKTKYKTETKTK